MTLQAWEDYIEGLCANHPEVLHENNSRRAFVPYESPETTLIHSDIATPYVRHAGFFFNGRAENQWYYTSVLLFLAKPESNMGNLPDAIVQCRKDTQLILEQFEARIWSDMNSREICSLLEDVVDVQVEAVDAIDQESYGWEMTITVSDKKIDHNPELWLDTQ